jgi:FtsZ-interacting cell division protein ZipA
MRKSLKSLFGDCNTIMILIILLSILLLSIIWYKKRQYEFFEEQKKTEDSKKDSKEDSKEKTVTEIKLSGKCANITLKSKDIGKDCFGQLWAENKCNNPIPEYNDDFKALSYEEITKEIKDSSCYTNEDWKKTSYRFVREQALKPIPSSTQLSMPSTSKPDEKSQTTEDGKASSSRMSLVDSAKYILKTMLTPDTAPIYDKEETIKSTEKIDTPTDNKNTVGVSVYQLKV